MSRNQVVVVDLLKNHKHFRIRLPRYDGGANVFWPEYRWSKVRVMKCDVIAAWLGDDIEMGFVTNVVGDLISMNVIKESTAVNPTNRLQVKIHRNNVSAIMHPE